MVTLVLVAIFSSFSKQAVTGEVLLRCSYKGLRTPRPLGTGTRGLSALPSFDAQDEDDPENAVPVLHWLQVTMGPC